MCRSRLTFSLESAQRVGALAGWVMVAVATSIIVIGGVDVMRSWRFWACWMALAYVLGAILTMLTARLALYDDVRRDPRRWQLFPNVPPRSRRFLIVSSVVVFGGSILLMLPWSPPLWLEIILNVAICVAGVFGLIGAWHVLFGARGIMRG